MKNNSFKIGNFTLTIEKGFIPFGDEYEKLRKHLNTQIKKSGSFKMNFNNNNMAGQNDKLLLVKFKNENHGK